MSATSQLGGIARIATMVLCTGIALNSVVLGDPRPLYGSPSDPVPQRVQQLMAKMTLEEKIAQLFSPDSTDYNKMKNNYANTSFSSISVGTGAANVGARNNLQEFMLNHSRLAIPVAFFHESLHGGCGGGTVFPMPLTMGTTWNVTLVEDIYRVVAFATRACGANIAFAPVINLFVDPRFGRHQEGFSPNPTLTAHMARAAVAGLQGSTTGNATTYLDQLSVVSLGKHFAAYGAATGGLNAAPALMGERHLRDVFLKPWRFFAQAGGRGAMPSHQTVLDVPCHANDWLVNQVFRQELGFGEGLTISDCNDINVLMDFGIAANASQASAKALHGGVDQDLQCGNTATYGFETIKSALADGILSQDSVDAAVRHVLTMKFASGLFDSPMTNPDLQDDLDNATHRQIALEAAQQGIVLVQNNNNALPLGAPEKEQIAVLGPLGDDSSLARQSMLGSYTSDDGSIHVVSIVEALSKYTNAVTFSSGATIDSWNYSNIQAAIKTATNATTIVVAVGDSLKSCGEWLDRDTLDLAGSQLALLNNITQAYPNKKVIVVLINGRPATFGPQNGALSAVDAVLVAGRPGEEGGTAIADIMFGKVNPSGKLASAWPRSVGQVNGGATPFLQAIRGKWISNKRYSPDPDGRVYDPYTDSMDDPTPLFPFGFGLSFTEFDYSEISVKTRSRDDPVPATVSFSIKNKGNVAGAEVFQVYVQDPVGTESNVVRFWKRLAAFGRIALEPGQSHQVSADIEWNDLAYHDDNMNMTVSQGTYTVRVGGSSVDDVLTATFQL